MKSKIFKDKEAQNRMENWYQRFLDRANVETQPLEVETSFGASHVLTAGDRSNPPLICLHAMMTSSAHLITELAGLLDHFYIIAPDLPGQSVKGLPRRLPYSNDSHAMWLQEVLKGLNLNNIHLLGISLGGFVARQFASSHPDKVKSLVLIVPAGIVQGSLVKGFTKMALPMVKYKIRPTQKNLRNFVGHLITSWDEDWAKYFGDAFNDFNPNLKIPTLATQEELENLTMPCLVIGAEDDISFPGDKVIERVKAHVPNVETELLKGSKHSPPTTPEFHDWLAGRIKSFLG